MGSMKPQIKFREIFFCEMVIQDVNTQKLTLIGLFQQIVSHVFPIIHSRMHVFFELTDIEKTPTSIKIAIKDPNGRQIVENGGPYDSQSKAPNINANFVLLGIPFEQPGDYSVEAIIDGEVIASRVLPVVKIPTTT